MVVSTNPVYDVVFVVEDTANLAAYMETLKANYILPTLKYFNGGPPDSIDYGHDFSCSLYVLVTYNSGDSMSSLSANCTRPTTSIHEFTTWLDGTEFLGGAGQSSSLLAEGLSTALQVFDDIKTRRHESIISQKHCILLCNSPPYHLPSQESFNYSGLYSNQIAAMMAKRGINLSIISPRKIPALQELFEEASSPDLAYLPHKDYTIDPRHMVLLHGYQLEERSHSPSLEDEKQTSEFIKLNIGKTEGSDWLIPDQPSNQNLWY
ncbi:mediator of RNA polymerase II transcription subunit 25 isoform X2 [Patella vulgata]|uniref:mediator of RNA polymerase II transcription subunit 25 isoform X2 n=1 Tax=Patella vulgata TaxID=6465 RepID=UPI00218096AF|nr:mediator of RNA polymerase II transcription subunit 25 isoform X2 [Patella vulgata]